MARAKAAKKASKAKGARRTSTRKTTARKATRKTAARKASTRKAAKARPGKKSKTGKGDDVQGHALLLNPRTATTVPTLGLGRQSTLSAIRKKVYE